MDQVVLGRTGIWPWPGLDWYVSLSSSSSAWNRRGSLMIITATPGSPTVS